MARAGETVELAAARGRRSTRSTLVDVGRHRPGRGRSRRRRRVLRGHVHPGAGARPRRGRRQRRLPRRARRGPRAGRSRSTDATRSTTSARRPPTARTGARARCLLPDRRRASRPARRSRSPDGALDARSRAASAIGVPAAACAGRPGDADPPRRRRGRGSLGDRAGRDGARLAPDKVLVDAGRRPSADPCLTPRWTSSTAIERLEPGTGRSFVVVGVFDGLHLGHAYLLEHLVARPRARDARPAVITFDHHPDEVLTGPRRRSCATRPSASSGWRRPAWRSPSSSTSTSALRETPYDAFVGRIASACAARGLPDDAGRGVRLRAARARRTTLAALGRARRVRGRRRPAVRARRPRRSAARTSAPRSPPATCRRRSGCSGGRTRSSATSTAGGPA